MTGTAHQCGEVRQQPVRRGVRIQGAVGCPFPHRVDRHGGEQRRAVSGDVRRSHRAVPADAPVCVTRCVIDREGGRRSTVTLSESRATAVRQRRFCQPAVAQVPLTSGSSSTVDGGNARPSSCNKATSASSPSRWGHGSPCPTFQLTRRITSRNLRSCERHVQSWRDCPQNIPCVGTPPARAQATIWFAKYPSTSWEVPDDDGMWLGSASTADHVRRSGGGVRAGVDRAGVAARSGAVPTLAARRRHRTRCMVARWRSPWRVALVGVTSSRRWSPLGSRRTWRSRPIRRRRVVASGTPRPIAATVGCCASCWPMVGCRRRGSHRRWCWSGANGRGSTRRWSISARRGCSGSMPSCISTA